MSISEAEAVRLWEETVGDSGEAPTDAELFMYANAVVDYSQEMSAIDERYYGVPMAD